ncbi:hypothetical protein KQ41_16380 [Lysinibacillus fusiformis]|nr:hypothetical protein KQ41_16380 [Lysinibacillus fusiformis]
MDRFIISRFLQRLLRKETIGYATPDVKVIDCLTELIPQWAGYTNVNVTMHRDKIQVDGKDMYRIWTSSR